jgi:hypothetical protein
MTPLETATHARTASRRVLAACAILERAGCRVLAASAHARPSIEVDRAPRIDWLQSGRKVSSPWHEVHATRLGGVQIEWRIPRRPVRWQA